MLLDNKQKFVELVMDNIMWGNVTLDKHEAEKYTTKDNLTRYVDYMLNFSWKYHDEKTLPILPK